MIRHALRFPVLLASLAACGVAAQNLPPSTHRPATAAAGHHAVSHPMHCPVPPPALSAKIPPVSAALGCPKVEYALTYIDTKVGTGELAQPHKFYTVQYTGYLTDGTKFDSSYDHGQPFTFPYGAHQVIRGWDTGFEGMHVGGKRRIFIPWQLAYGEMGHPPVIPPKANLVFDVELLSQSDTPPPPPGTQPSAPSTGSSGSANPSGTAAPSSSTPPPHPQR